MVQVIYEEGTEEYWQKPLREAILNIGNSWAGSIIRRQNSAASYAKNAADRAHEAYIAQIGINSREKIAGATLAATKERNETLNKQYTSSHELQQRKVQNDEDHTAYLRGQDLDSYNAISAHQEWENAQGTFKVENDTIVPRGLSQEDRTRVQATIKKSPTIWAATKNDRATRVEKQKDIAGKLSTIMALEKKHKGVFSKILYGPNSTEQVTLANFTGTAGESLLNNMAARVMNPTTWKAIVDEYGVDDSVLTGIKDLKKHHYTAMGEWGNIVKANGLNIKEHPVQLGLTAATTLQQGAIKGYNASRDHLEDKEKTNNGEAILASVKGENLDKNIQENIINTTRLFNGAAINFMHKNHLYYSAPSGISSLFRKRIADIVQEGGEKEYGNVIDKKLKELVFSNMDEPTQNKYINDVMGLFMKGQLKANPQTFRSVTGNRTGENGMVSKMNAWFNTGDSSVPEKTLVNKKKTGDLTVGEVDTQTNKFIPINTRDFLRQNPNPWMNNYFYGTGGKRMGGVVLDANKDAILTGFNNEYKVNLSKTPIDQVASWMFDESVENREAGPGKFFGSFLKEKKRIASTLSPEQIEKWHSRQTNIVSAISDKIGDIMPTWLGGDTEEEMAEEKENEAAYTELKRLTGLYAFNRSVAAEVAIQRSAKAMQNPGGDDVSLFGLEGKVGPWIGAFKAKDADKGGVLYTIDKALLDKKYPANHANPLVRNVRKQLLMLMEVLGSSDKDDGTVWGASDQLRALALHLEARGANTNYTSVSNNEVPPISTVSN